MTSASNKIVTVHIPLSREVFWHDRGRKVYVTLNDFARNHDLNGAEEYIKGLYDMGVDAVLVADPALIAICKEAAPDLEIHLSTQANTVNWKAIL